MNWLKQRKRARAKRKGALIRSINVFSRDRSSQKTRRWGIPLAVVGVLLVLVAIFAARKLWRGNAPRFASPTHQAATPAHPSQAEGDLATVEENLPAKARQ